MLLALDLDGVLCDLGPAVAARLAERFGVVAHPTTWVSYDLGHLGLPGDAMRTFLDATFADPGLYRRAPVCPGAASALGALADAGWRIEGVTARASHLTSVTRRWVAGLGLPIDRVHHAPFLAKAATARRIGADAAIEDNAQEAELLGEVCGSWLLDRPYNRGHVPARCRRVLSWADAVGRLCELRRSVG